MTLAPSRSPESESGSSKRIAEADASGRRTERPREKRLLKRIKRFVRYYLLRGIALVVGLLPLAGARRLGAALGALAFILARGERKKALASLARAFPNASEADRVALARASFRHLGTCATEMCCLRQIDRALDLYVELPSSERAVLEDALAEGHGVVFVTGHVGNFELMARRIGRGGFPCHTIAKEASDPRTTVLIQKTRESGGVRVLWRGSERIVRDMFGVLKRGEVLGLLIDQDTRVQGVFVDFFGEKAFTPRAAADLALRTGAAIVMGFIFRRPDGGHRIELGRIPLPPSTSDRDADSVALTQTMTSAIERAIRSAPEAWVWMHQRWKTRP
jgi:Kdo2-lipid IVA lauroyltransferase/acyltransferase